MAAKIPLIDTLRCTKVPQWIYFYKSLTILRSQLFQKARQFKKKQNDTVGGAFLKICYLYLSTIYHSTAKYLILCFDPSKGVFLFTWFIKKQKQKKKCPLKLKMSTEGVYFFSKWPPEWPWDNISGSFKLTNKVKIHHFEPLRRSFSP